MDEPKLIKKTQAFEKKPGLKKKGFKNKKRQFKPKINTTTREAEEITRLQKGVSEELANMVSDEVETFAMLPLSQKTLKGLREAKFLMPTKVQRQSLIFSLRGLDVVAAAKTGSGKTLAFVIPLLESLFCKKWTKLDGLGALIITPTRELAYQIFEVLNKVGKHHDFSAGLVIGGKDLKYEWARVSSCNIMVCTPGRLLQHMTENAEFDTTNVQMVILDEADQCLSMGFADTMNCILEDLPQDRQTLLFSATQTRDVKDLVRAGCHKPIFCSVHEHSKTTTPKGLQESYVVCEAHDKFTFLWSFIRHHKKHKILVFLSTCKQVQYVYNMFCKLHPGLSVMGLHGSMHQLRRMAVYDEFCQKKSAVLFATDVASRGLDIPAVDWVVQADCPEDVTTYIHRAGRTARYSNTGQALLLLTPTEETAMLAKLRPKNIPIERLDVDPSKMHNIHVKLEIILSKYTNLKEDAVRAFKAYLKHLSYMKDRKVFDVTSVDLDAFARSLGLAVTPRIRFLEKRLKQKIGKGGGSTELSQPGPHAPDNPTLTTLNFGADDSDDDDDEDFLSTAKDQKVYLGSGEEDNEEEVEGPADTNLPPTKPKPSKPLVTKAKVVKKLIKKNLQINNRVEFDDEGELVLDPTKQQISKAAREETDEERNGINITKLKEIMKEEDRIDKKLHAEKAQEKKKLKKKKEKVKNSKIEEEEEEEESDYEEDSEVDDDYTQAIIDDLPDPDKYYGPAGDEDQEREGGEEGESEGESEGGEEGESEEGEEGESSSEEDQTKVSGKRRAKERAREVKRVRLAEKNTLESLPVDEQEQLALFLLRGHT